MEMPACGVECRERVALARNWYRAIPRITRTDRPQGLKHFWLRLTLRIVTAGPLRPSRRIVMARGRIAVPSEGIPRKSCTQVGAGLKNSPWPRSLGDRATA